MSTPVMNEVAIGGSLANMTYELATLGGRTVFGKGTQILVIPEVDFGSTGTTAADAPAPRADGIRMGRDYKGARSIIFSLAARVRGNPEGTLDAADQFLGIWSDDEGRDGADNTAILRWNRFRHRRRVYGRPRDPAFTSGEVNQSYAPITAMFQCIDHLYYDDTEYSNTIAIVPSAVSTGVFAPVREPVRTLTNSLASGAFTVGGSSTTPMMFRVQGPIVNPEIEVFGRFRVRVMRNLLSDQHITIDARPWRHSIILNDFASISGELDPYSTRLSKLRLPPGQHTAVLRGFDPTGTSTLTTTWRNAFHMP